MNDLKSQLGLERAPRVLSTLPANGETKIFGTTSISVTFSEAMRESTLTSGTSAICTGSLQVSKDNFVTCIAMNSASPIISAGMSGYAVATWKPATTLAAGSTYAMRVTSAAQNLFGNAVPAVETLFTTLNSPGMGTSTRSVIVVGNTNSAFSPELTLDEPNNKIYVATRDQSNSDKPALIICNLDATGCVYRDISAGQGASSNQGARIGLDKKNNKVIVGIKNGANASRIGHIVCDADGTNCTHQQISAISMGGHGMVVDDANERVLHFGNSGQTVYVYNCNMSGTTCVPNSYAISMGAPTNMRGVLDTKNYRLLIAMNRSGDGTGTNFERCSGDGTGCIEISFGASALDYPYPTIDTISDKLLVAFSLGTLRRCELNATGCTSHNVITLASATIPGVPKTNAFDYPKIAYDKAFNKVFISSERNDAGYIGRTVLYSCEADFSACVHNDISQNLQGWLPYPQVDYTNGKLITVSTAADDLSRLQIYRN